MPYYIMSIQQLIDFSNGATVQGASLGTPNTAGTSIAPNQDEIAALNTVASAGYVPTFTRNLGASAEWILLK